MRNFNISLTLAAGFCIGLGCLLPLPTGRGLARPAPSHLGDDVPQPTPNVLDVPVLPDNPTEVQVGEVVYYYNCMPCHGDHGQGLTDEFRQIWVEDHQNCWARGCHGGRRDDQGFPIPKTVPAVSARPDQLQRFASPEDLFDYLESTHPPQMPGVLKEDEYWAVTALLLSSNQRLASDGAVGPQTVRLLSIDPLTAIGLFLVISVLVAGLFIWQSKPGAHP